MGVYLAVTAIADQAFEPDCVPVGPRSKISQLPNGGCPPLVPFMSAELKGPRKLLRIRPGIVDVRPKWPPTPDKAKPKMPGAVPTNRNKPMPIDVGPVSVFRPRSKSLSNCEIPVFAK